MSDVRQVMAGSARLRVAPALGGRIVDLRLATRDGRTVDVLAPFPEDVGPEALLHWPKGGLYPLLPYGNRVRDARLRFGGRDYALPPHPDAAPHTLHGHAHRVPWRITRQNGSSLAWALDHAGGREWPWPFRATLTADLSEREVVIDVALTNTGSGPMPAGLGLHPYFVHDPADVPTFRTALDWPVTPDNRAELPRPHGADVESGRPLPPGDFTFYRSGWDGTFALRRPGGVSVTIRADPVFDHLVVHRPATAPYICVEPATHAPDGFNMAEAGVREAGRIVLAPDATCRGTVRIAVSL